MPSDLITKLRYLYSNRDSAYDASLKAQAADRLGLYEREALATEQERARRFEAALRRIAQHEPTMWGEPPYRVARDIAEKALLVPPEDAGNAR